MKPKTQKEIIREFFGQFQDWLKNSGYGDPFSTDVWMLLCSQALINKFQREAEQGQAISMFANKATPEMLEQMAADKRKEKAEKAKRYLEIVQ